KYLIYSHHHFDHISGGKPFKDAGARVIAHKNAKTHLAQTKNPNVVMPDETFDKTKAIKLGGTTLELSYLGLNHSDSNIVLRLQEASAEMKPLGISGKCWGAEKDIKLTSFKDWPGYPANLEFIGRRYCGVWGRGT